MKADDGRPPEQPPRTAIEAGLEIAGATAAVLLAVVLVWTLRSGRGLGGEALVMPLSGIGTYALLAWLSRHPRLYNYPWRITAENAAAQYRLARRLVLAMGVLIAWSFLGITWATTGADPAHRDAWALGGSATMMVGMAGLLLAYFVAAHRAR